eukprot:2711620-Prymnesium_polylepis.1
MFAEEKNLNDLIKFETFVTALEPVNSGKGWKMKLAKKDGDAGSEDFDFVVVATGMYSWPPHIPTAPNMDTFKGEILHSCQFLDASICKDKNVVVVGGGKSSIDCCVAAAKNGAKASSL